MSSSESKEVMFFFSKNSLLLLAKVFVSWDAISGVFFGTAVRFEREIATPLTYVVALKDTTVNCYYCSALIRYKVRVEMIRGEKVDTNA